jgi:hypothetical protein
MHSWVCSRLIPSIELALSAEMGKHFEVQEERLEFAMVPCLAIRERRWFWASNGLTPLFSNTHLLVLEHGDVSLSHDSCLYRRRSLFFCVD